MYRLIVVDDEEEVRKGIIEKIPWKELGFTVIGEAANGVEALEIADKAIPDVVITDIKMPFLDGIKLSEEMKMRFPTVKIAIITGFDEFEYAQKAVKLMVEEYILKPISAGELIEVLLKLKAKLDEEAAQKKDMEALKEYYIKSLPLIREKFLDSLIRNNFSKEEILEKSKAYGLNISGTNFLVSVINMDFKIASENKAYDIRDKELLRFAVVNIGEEILYRQNKDIIFRSNDYIVIIFSSNDSSKDKFIRTSLFTLEEIRQSIKKYIKVTATIGVGTFEEDICSISYSYDSAVSALDYKLIFGNNKVIFIEDVEPQYTNKIVFDETKERALISSLKVGTMEEIQKNIDILFNEIIPKKASFKEYNIYLIEVLTTILKVARDLQVNISEALGANINPFAEINNFINLQDVKSWMIDISKRIKSSICKERQDSCKLLVDKVIEHVNSNYGDSELTVEKLCMLLHISPNYFSAIFKKETKQNFSSYLTDLRLKRARELLLNTNLKTFEIAKRVGYSEANYFSYCFKKNLAISPSEYRNSRISV
jgi:two-component system, response regulator YesN